MNIGINTRTRQLIAAMFMGLGLALLCSCEKPEPPEPDKFPLERIVPPGKPGPLKIEHTGQDFNIKQ